MHKFTSVHQVRTAALMFFLGSAVAGQADFEDYRDVDGMKFAFTI